MHESLLSRRLWSSSSNPPRKTVLAALETRERPSPRSWYNSSIISEDSRASLSFFKPSKLHFYLFNFNINKFNNNKLIDSNCLGFDLYLKK